MNPDFQYQLSICIPSYENSDILEKNVLNLCRQLGEVNFRWEIIIGLNYSEKEPYDNIKNLNNSKIKVFIHKSNLGFGKNLFFTINQATGQYILLLGDDDFTENGVFQEIEEKVIRSEALSGLSFVPICGSVYNDNN